MPTNDAPVAAAPRAAHPCFDAEAKGTHGRVHLPVAPACNVQCNYCNRDHDCVAESRPGVTSTVLEPWQAERYLAEVVAADPSISVAGIAGPGDALASAAATLETLALVRRSQPQLLTCVATNGLALPEHADALADLGVTHVTVTVNAVDAEIGRGLYAWIRHGRELLRGRAAAELLWRRQEAGIRRLSARGVAVKINTIVVPGINDDHVAAVAAACAAAGASLHNCMALIPVAGSEFADHPAPSQGAMHAARAAAGASLPQMAHCARCRADAVGRIGEGMSQARFQVLERHKAAAPPGRRLVAAASREGVFVNEHLGHAEEFLIYDLADGAPVQVGIRRAPAAGGGGQRWQAVAELLADCRALLCAGIGPSPAQVLRASGLRVHETEGLIDELVPRAHAGGDIQKLRKPFRCGDGCGGNALGCA